MKMKHILFLLTILSITFSQNFGFGGRYQNNEFVTLSFLSSKIEIDLGLGFSQSSVNDVDTSFSIFNFQEYQYGHPSPPDTNLFITHRDYDSYTSITSFKIRYYPINQDKEIASYIFSTISKSIPKIKGDYTRETDLDEGPVDISDQLFNIIEASNSMFEIGIGMGVKAKFKSSLLILFDIGYYFSSASGNSSSQYTYSLSNTDIENIDIRSIDHSDQSIKMSIGFIFLPWCRSSKRRE